MQSAGETRATSHQIIPVTLFILDTVLAVGSSPVLPSNTKFNQRLNTEFTRSQCRKCRHVALNTYTLIAPPGGFQAFKTA